MTATATVIRADARSLPLPDNSVDLICTSPPYFGLRSYTDGGVHFESQIGSEGTPGEWLDALLACTREWVRVLKPEGSLFVNLGDKYASGGRATYNGTWRRDKAGHSGARPQDGFPEKSLLGLPWRYALTCMDQFGLILRAEIIWAKPNGLPESVTDRVRRAHEQVFHFTRMPRYYSAVDEIREPASTVHHVSRPGPVMRNSRADGQPSTLLAGFGINPLGKLPGSVWPIPSQPLQVPDHLGVDHFAAFPMELPRRCILGWSPPGVCTACGQGRRPVVDDPSPAGHVGPSVRDVEANGHVRYGANSRLALSGGPSQRWKAAHPATIIGYACDCTPFHWESSPRLYDPDAEVRWKVYEWDRWTPPPTTPSVCLDPFGGTGTTALVASVLGRHGITADLSADYCRLAAWRCTDPGERARAMQVPKPPPVPDGQEALFTL